ncbi:MAG TPA: squalene synthase HpnC [Actinomycetota bacterium]
MAKAGGENFPVAPVLLGRRLRGHLLAVYGFARLVDDLGDEAKGDRLAQLDLFEQDLARIWSGTPRDPLLVRLQPTVREFSIPPEPFQRLIEANRQDQRVSRYQTYQELLDYCVLSANPVGHLVLYVFGKATPERLRLSDAVCTGLQLVEHWQDVAEDLARDRVYLPREDLAAFGCDERDLAALHASGRLRKLLAFEAGRAAALLDEGAPLIGLLTGRARLAVTGFLAGGRAALAAIADAGYDVLPGPPKPSRPRLVREAVSVLLRNRNRKRKGKG